MKFTSPIVLFVVLILFGSVHCLHAQVARFFDGGPSGTGTDYNTAVHWTGDDLPDTSGVGGERSFVNRLGVRLSSVVAGAAHDALIGIGAGGAGSLTLDSGASLSIANALSIGFNAEGFLIMNDGFLSSDGIGVGSYADQGFAGTLTMNGGVIDTRIIQSTQDEAVFNFSGGMMNVVGLNFNAGGSPDGTTVNWDLSSGTTTVINLSGGLFMVRDADFNFDVSGLGVGDYTLVHNNGSGIVDHTGSVSFANLGSGLSASVNSSGNGSGDDLVLSIFTVPEPSSMALLGLAGIALILRRGRMV